MSTPRIVEADAAGLAAAIDAVAAGLIAALPTDTLYALATSTTVEGASRRLFALKRRDRALPLPVLCADLEQAATVGVLEGEALRLARRHWPGPLTLAVPRRRGFGADLGDDATTVGLRVSDDDVTRAVAAAAGPLATSSANLHGRDEPPTPDAIAALFGDDLAVVVRRASPGSGLASTVVLCGSRGEVVEVLRRGAVDLGGSPTPPSASDVGTQTGS